MQTNINQYDSNGLKQGYWEFYYKDGSLKKSCWFVDNKVHGEYVSYLPNGKLDFTGQFSHGKIIGLCVWYEYYGKGSTQLEFYAN